jgi:hypothetical protein
LCGRKFCINTGKYFRKGTYNVTGIMYGMSLFRKVVSELLQEQILVLMSD